MRASKYIKKLAFTNIIKKKQRTFLSLIAISLSVAIIFTSLTLFTNVFSLTKIPNNETTGQYHYIINSSSGEPLTRHSATFDYELGLYDTLENRDISFHQLVQENENSPLPIILKEGHLPQNENEIVIPESFTYHLNDLISLNNNTDYRVVGIYQSTELYAELNQNLIPVYTIGNVETAVTRNIIIMDNQIQRADSLSMISEEFDIDTQDIYLNSDAITYDTVKNYLKDTTTLLIMFIAIVVIAALMSVISLKNVFIITDKDRKKEFGLLKSIGATPKDISSLLKIELSVLGILGALIGIILGIGISNVVLKMFIQQLSLTFNWSMILNPFILVVSFLIGFLLMFTLGLFSYKPYIHSNAIDDLKDVSYNYDPPRQNKSYTSKSFSWKMFLIYNGRLKKQTRNIFHSFTLLILTTVIFLAVFLSSHDYKKATSNVDYDFEITNSIAMNAATPINLEIYDEIYKAIDNKEIIPASMDIKRLVLGPYIQYPVEAVNQENFKIYKSTARVNYIEDQDETGKTFGQIQTSTLLLDHEQIERLKPYVISGSLDNLDEGGAILILRKNSEVGDGLFDKLSPGDNVYLSEELNNTLKEEIKAVVAVDEGVSGLYCDYDEYPRILAMSSTYGIKYQNLFSIKESAKITLDNQATVTKATLAIEQAILTAGQENNYSYDNVLLRSQENRVISFMIESLLYPLFFLLFIISLLNINNVLVGNVHLKRGDISIMKSVGMTSLQLYKLFIFEYLEGYINASALVIAIFIPLCIIESKLKISSAFMLSQNIMITLLVAIMVVDIFIVAVMVVLSLNKIRKVEAIENMKDIV